MVKADDYDINPSRFASPQEMEDNLNELLAETPARVQVEMVAEWPDLGPQNFCHYLVSGEEGQFCLFKYGTYFEQESWAEHLHHLAQVPYIWARYNCAQLERHLADYCYRRSALPAGIAGPRRTEEEWWLLTLPDVDASLLIPITSSILQLTTDDDGQTVTVQLHSAAHRTRQNRLEDSFRRRHGALLDDAQPLSATHAVAIRAVADVNGPHSHISTYCPRHYVATMFHILEVEAPLNGDDFDVLVSKHGPIAEWG